MKNMVRRESAIFLRSSGRTSESVTDKNYTSHRTGHVLKKLSASGHTLLSGEVTKRNLACQIVAEQHYAVDHTQYVQHV